MLRIPTFALVLALISSASAWAAPSLVDRLEASVNASLVLRSDVKKFRQTVSLRAQLDPLFAGTALANKGSNATDSEIVDFLIDDKLILAAFPVNDSEVEQEINSIQANNHIDRASLRRALQEQGFSFDDYFELIRISASKRNLIDRDIRTKVSISDDDIKNYYLNHYSGSTSAANSYKLKLITVTNSNYKSAAAARDVAERALKEIKSGEPFEEVAKRVSDDANAGSGGDLGTLSDDQLSPVIREQIKKLQIGGVSGVFKSNRSFMIVKLADIKTGDSDRLNKAKEEIRNQLAASEYQHQISLWLERQRQTAFIHRAGEPSIAGLSQSE